MKKYFISLITLFCSIANAQSVTLVGENYLMLNGERFKNQKIIFNKADGDWFATANDTHGTIGMDASFEGRQMRLDLEWDGKEEVHVITNEIRHQQRKGEFIITMSDKNVYGDGLNAYPNDEQEVKIIVHSINETNVSGEIAGWITQGNDKVKVAGFFNLKKNATANTKKITSSTYKDCDNVVHDKLIGAEGRSPSECEAKYDLDVRTAIHDAVVAVAENFQKQGWEVQSETDLSPLTIVGRGSEKDIFNTTYEIKMAAAPTSQNYNYYQKKMSDYMEKMKEASKETYNEFVKFTYEMKGNTQAFIRISVNNHSAGFGNFRGGAQLTKLSPGVFKIQSPYVQGRTGGDETESMDATFLLIGNWKQPVIEKQSDGGEAVKATAIINPSASHLQAQNIFIRMECSNAMADEIIKKMDLPKLQSIVNH